MMSTALHVCLVLWCLQNSPVGAELAPPQDVTMIALNTNYTLTWEWDQSSAKVHNVTFTTQYIGHQNLNKKSPKWSTACEEMLRRSCDFTAFNLHYLGIYMLRVRANENGHHSKWVEKEFCPDQDAAVGPPSKVDLAPAGNSLDVVISDPLTNTNSSMKEHLHELYYHIVYWERPADTQALRTQMLDSSANIVTLPNLKAWTWYCVHIQSRYDFYNKSSSFTIPQCMQTEGNTPWWQIFLYFLGSLLLCFLVMLLLLYSSFCFYKKLKTTLWPSIQLPSHFKEYLCDSPHLLTMDAEGELLCDKVTVCPELPVLEIHNPPPEALLVPPLVLEPDSSGRHSRQNSSSSGDSGIYSTGGRSHLQQPNSSQSSMGPKDVWQISFDLEKVKMQEMASGLKNQLITDEGIVDICV